MELRRAFVNDTEPMTPESRLMIAINMTRQELDDCKLSLDLALQTVSNYHGQYQNLKDLGAVFTEANTRTAA